MLFQIQRTPAFWLVLLLACLLHTIFFLGSSVHWLLGTGLAAVIFTLFFGYLLKLRERETTDAQADPLI